MKPIAEICTNTIKEKDMIINYIKNQKEYHKVETFYDEFKRLLIEKWNRIDEKYLLSYYHTFNPFGVVLPAGFVSVSFTHGY